MNGQLELCRSPHARQLTSLSELALTNCSILPCKPTCDLLCNLVPDSPRVFSLGAVYEYEIETEFDNNTTQILLKIEGRAGELNFTSYQVIKEANEFEGYVTSFEEFACSEVTISYAWIINGSFSAFSPSVTLCLDKGVPGPVTEFSYNITGTSNCADITTPQIGLKWEPAMNSSLLSHYTLSISPINSFTDAIEKVILKNETNTVMQIPESFTNPSNYSDTYAVTMTSHPGGYITQGSFKLPTPKLTISCADIGRFDPYMQKYNVTIKWEVKPNDCSVLTRLHSFVLKLRMARPVPGGIHSADIGSSVIIEEIFPDVTLLPEVYSYTFSGLDPQRVGRGYSIEFKTTFPGIAPPRWPSILQRYDDCYTSTPPVPPSQITNIQIRLMNIKPNTEKASISISWDPPLFPNGNITEYEVKVWSRYNNRVDNLHSQGGINGDRLEHNATFFLSSIYSFFYVEVRASNNWCQLDEFEPCYSNWSEPLLVLVGNNDTTINTSEPTVNSTSSSIPNPLVFMLLVIPVGLIIGIIIFIVIILCCCSYGGRCIKRNYTMEPFMDLSETGIKNFIEFSKHGEHSNLLNDGWEIPRNILEVHEDEMLGTGCFGEVCKGSLQMSHVLNKRRLSHERHLHYKKRSMSLTQEHLTVAIKKLKRGADGKERSDFFKEIEIMKKVSELDSELKMFVVNMLGCCRLEEPVLLVVEFVRYGDLLNYLRSMKKRAKAVKDSGDLPAPYLEPLGAYSKLDPRDQLDNEGNLTERNLIDFSRQIASGMEYLSSLEIVHRDLACRNILVGDNRILKISDFGLSRVVPQDEVYTLTNHGLLPIRWMALESIFQREFTTFSDVWAYGIVLWEICTMGGFPYSTLQEKELLQLLKRGYRLPKPSNCSQEMFEVMLKCWHPEPTGRPKFPELHKLFDYFLSRHTQEQYPYIDMNESEPYTYDHLDYKPITSYHSSTSSNILNIEETEMTYTEGEKTSDYGSAKDLKFDSEEMLVPEANIDKQTLESGCYMNNVMLSRPEEIPDEDKTSAYDRLRGEHPNLMRVSQMGNKFPLHVLDYDEDEYYPEEENSLGMYDYYNNLWMKKLSTITEVSHEECCLDQM
jgi:proto-oncogene tyrosine-protein kinase Ret